MSFKKIKITGTVYFLAVIAAGSLFSFAGWAHAIRVFESLKALGLPGAVLFTVLFILGTLMFIPITLLFFSGGVLYGFVQGSVISTISCTLGACIAFLLSRYFF